MARIVRQIKTFGRAKYSGRIKNKIMRFKDIASPEFSVTENDANKIRHIAFTLLASCFLLTAISQTSLKSNTVYFELGGNALFTSINYERQVLRNVNLNLHVGTGIYGVKPTYLTIPFGVRYLLKLTNSNSFIDFGFGATYSKADVELYAIVEHRNPNYKNTNYWNYIPSVGYRKLTKKNLVYRFSLTPVINHNDFLPFLGFSIGKNF